MPGRPRLYRTTKQFLRAFHLSSLEDLPELTEPSEEEDPLDPEADGQMRLGENGEIVSSQEVHAPDLVHIGPGGGLVVGDDGQGLQGRLAELGGLADLQGPVGRGPPSWRCWSCAGPMCCN